jgi:hypothetical protein
MDEDRRCGADSVVSSKLLSVVVVGRNDEYLGNFKYCISTCLNYLARGLKDLGRLDDVEILVTDWGSDVPLAKVLPLSPEAGHICSFVYVPPAITFTVRPDGGFCDSWAVNAALRRGKGKFLMLSIADCLFPRHSLQALLDLLDGKVDVFSDVNSILFLLPRYQVPWEIVRREPTLEEWDRYLLLTAGSLPHDQGLPGLGIATAGQMMHRSIWHECYGHNEQLVGAAWTDAELTLRITQCYPWMDLSNIGVSVFHMAHWPHNRPMTWPNAVINPHVVSSTFAANDENWGLGNYELDVKTAENIVGSSRTNGSLETVGPVKRWSQTQRELLDELTSSSIREHVQKTVESTDIDTVEWESLCVLSWYSLHRFPRTYLEFGIQDTHAAIVVGAACPGVEIYGIGSWQASDRSGPVGPPDYVTGMLRHVGYQGYTRLVTGEPCTAFRRLRDSFVGCLSLDLALVRGDMFGADLIQQLSDLIQHLSPGGMLVFTCGSAVDFERVWREMRAKFTQFTHLRCKTGKTGLILAASLQNHALGASLDGDQENRLGVDFGKPPRPSFARQLVRVRRALRNPRGYPEYAKRICRFLLSRG